MPDTIKKDTSYLSKTLFIKGLQCHKALYLHIPELSYDGMEISNGGMAMNAYSTMCQTEDPGELERIRKALLEYCKFDTLGMVRILEKLRKTARRGHARQ